MKLWIIVNHVLPALLPSKSSRSYYIPQQKQQQLYAAALLAFDHEHSIFIVCLLQSALNIILSIINLHRLATQPCACYDHLHVLCFAPPASDTLCTRIFLRQIRYVSVTDMFFEL